MHKIHIREKIKYQIDLPQMLKISANVYWKDVNGVHLGCNELTAQETGLASCQDYIGLTIYDISEKSIAESIFNNDLQIIQTGISHVMIERSAAIYADDKSYLSIKMPLKDQNNKIVGLFGISYGLDNYNVLTNTFINFKMQNIISDAGLTNREKEILELIMQGKNAKEIGKLFSISYRTVEGHIAKLKLKLKCKNLSELYLKIL